MKSRSFNILIILALFLSLLGGAVTVTPARAASIVVNTNADNTTTDGLCTLREALTNADNDAATYPDCTAGSGTDTITFTGNYVITTTSVLPINSNITINGTGTADTIIQASSCNPITLPGGCTPATYRVFSMSPLVTFNLNNLTIRHGNCSSCVTGGNTGGGLFISNGATVTLNNVNVSDNLAGDGGGGIYNFFGALTMTNSTISGNRATGNGGGGGIYNNSGALTITNSTISGNSSTGTGFGGGVVTIGSSTTISNSTFSGNSTSSNGGGLYTLNNNPTISNSTFSNNSANNGGGIHSITSSPTISNTTFSGNSASLDGGGMYNTNGSSPTISNSTFSGNSATNGGGMYNFSNSSPTISNSTFSGNSANRGGGMYNIDNSPTISNSTFSGNSASVEGGGIYNINLGRPTLKNTIIANSTGGDCINDTAGSINGASSHNLIESTGSNACNITASFGGGSNIVGSDPALNALANNGGVTQTMALQAGSDAIDAGDATTCNNAPVSGKDQRGVTRPQGAGCDIGAYEAGALIPIVTASNPSAGATLTSLSSITVVFNQDMLDNATADGAENVNNYILVERGANTAFDTTSCAGGVVSDDVPQTISTASYNSAGFVTSLTLASPLTAGTYRLFVCGTTSVWSAAGLELNNGASDYTADFTINSSTGTGSATATQNTSASALPKTGFAPKTITTLPAQPATLEYAKLGDIVLEIPSLNVKSTIVGVPQNADKTWDVTWLGNDTGWLNGTAFPTWNGNSVLTAHVTNASGLEGPFAALKSLKYGDQIIVHMGGVQYIYEVRATKLSRPYTTNYAFESKQDAAYLTLITCAGYNPLNESYLFRRVVRAVLIEVK